MDWERVLEKLDRILDRVEQIVPHKPESPDWTAQAGTSGLEESDCAPLAQACERRVSSTR